MKSLLNVSFNKVFVGVLLLLVGVNVIGAVSENALFLQSTKMLFVPSFLLFFFIKRNSIKIPFVLCLIYFFFGDSASLFFANDMFLNASNVLYFLSYLCLIIFVSQKFRIMEFNKIIAYYLIVVFLINLYFLYTTCSILRVIVPDGAEVFIFGLKSVSLIILLFISFGVYLNSESKMSIVFLLMAFSFACSDLLDYVNHYYVYNWSFLMLERILHVVGLFFLFNYIVAYNKLFKKQEIREVIRGSENVLV
ncbi:hypothetical protein [Yeosuana aromativorans]|nr:hypothetical protein [Yeosuana aromativorans]